MSSASAFEEHFAREIMHSERTRMAVLAGVLAALLAVFALFSALFREDYWQFGMRGVFVKTGAAMLALLGYELAVRQLIGRWLREGRRIPEPLRYLNAFVETSFPTLLIFLIARHTNPQYVLQGAAVLLYGVFIVLSTLRLDFRLSVFYGAVAAAEYLALCQAYLGTGGEALAATPFERAPFFLAKAAVLLAAGFAAGFVAHQIKRRAGNAFRAQEERQRIVSAFGQQRSEEHTSELQSLRHLVCRLLPLPPAIHPLSLHDALPISAPAARRSPQPPSSGRRSSSPRRRCCSPPALPRGSSPTRSSAAPAMPSARRRSASASSAPSASRDRKSTRLNSSHLGISYAVFCPCPPPSTLFPYTTLFRSRHRRRGARRNPLRAGAVLPRQGGGAARRRLCRGVRRPPDQAPRRQCLPRAGGAPAHRQRLRPAEIGRAHV